MGDTIHDLRRQRINLMDQLKRLRIRRMQGAGRGLQQFVIDSMDNDIQKANDNLARIETEIERLGTALPV